MLPLIVFNLRFPAIALLGERRLVWGIGGKLYSLLRYAQHLGQSISYLQQLLHGFKCLKGSAGKWEGKELTQW